MAHSQRAWNAEKLCKNRREHVRFSCKILQSFRAERSAHSKIWCRADLEDVQRLPRSLHSFCGRCARLPRQKLAESRAKSRDFRSKPARFGAKNTRKRSQSTFKNCAEAAHHLQHIKNHFSMRGALAARLQRAKTLQKPT